MDFLLWLFLGFIGSFLFMRIVHYLSTDKSFLWITPYEVLSWFAFSVLGPIILTIALTALGFVLLISFIVFMSDLYHEKIQFTKIHEFMKSPLPITGAETKDGKEI